MLHSFHFMKSSVSILLSSFYNLFFTPKKVIFVLWFTSQPRSCLFRERALLSLSDHLPNVENVGRKEWNAEDLFYKGENVLKVHVIIKKKIISIVSEGVQGWVFRVLKKNQHLNFFEFSSTILWNLIKLEKKKEMKKGNTWYHYQTGLCKLVVTFKNKTRLNYWLMCLVISIVAG